MLVALAAGVFRTDFARPLGGNGVIVFTAGGNNHEKAVTRLMNPDGTGDHPIDLDRCPQYSANGTTLATLSYQGSTFLSVMDANGNGSHQGPARRRARVTSGLRPVARRDPGRPGEAGRFRPACVVRSDHPGRLRRGQTTSSGWPRPRPGPVTGSCLRRNGWKIPRPSTHRPGRRTDGRSRWPATASTRGSVPVAAARSTSSTSTARTCTRSRPGRGSSATRVVVARWPRPRVRRRP